MTTVALSETSLFSENVVETIPPLTDDYWEAVRRAWHPLRPTKVFATYWYFAMIRQQIFFQRLHTEEPPWTMDPILCRHRFTNAYRASDRVSQYLIRHVQYPNNRRLKPEDVFFRTILFKLFNKIETWELIERVLGDIVWDCYDFDLYDGVLTRAMERHETIFSAAYIMPSGTTSFGGTRKHRNYLRLLETMMNDELFQQIGEMTSLRKVFERLRSYPLLGDFLAFQYAIDLNYSTLLNFSENSFVVAGPGARNGISKCFLERGGLSDEDIIQCMADRQAEEFGRLGLTFRSLWGRNLQLIDCQNLFCEVDKYARVAHPDVAGISGRTRIKQVYRPQNSSSLEECWYPPKWKLNAAIKSYYKFKVQNSDHL